MILSCVFIPFGKTKEKDEATQECAGTGEERASFLLSLSFCLRCKRKRSSGQVLWKSRQVIFLTYLHHFLFFYVGKVKDCEEKNNEPPFNLLWVEVRQTKRQEPAPFFAPNLSLSHLSHLPPLSFPFCFEWGKIKEIQRKSEKGERRSPFLSSKTAGIEERRRDRNRGRYGHDSLLFLRLLSPFLYC